MTEPSTTPSEGEERRRWPDFISGDAAQLIDQLVKDIPDPGSIPLEWVMNTDGSLNTKKVIEHARRQGMFDMVQTLAMALDKKRRPK